MAKAKVFEANPKTFFKKGKAAKGKKKFVKIGKHKRGFPKRKKALPPAVPPEGAALQGPTPEDLTTGVDAAGEMPFVPPGLMRRRS
jgi:hypothetical protein